MSSPVSIHSQPWIRAPGTRAVMKALTADGGAARFVGGCVRNALMGVPVEDIDIATPLMPEEVVRRIKAAGMTAVPTGIEHGTVTAVFHGAPDQVETFEITTLRRDVSTDGRRATVAFSSDWEDDARRRDFTMNAIYAEPDGEIRDVIGGLEDLRARRVRFIGDPAQRIAEDYLRILRLFRFHARYGTGDIDAEGLRACAAAKDQIKTLSGERIQKEMLRLLPAVDVVAVLRTMAGVGVLGEVLHGVLLFDRLQAVCDTDLEYFFEGDALLRLGAVLSDVAQAREIATRWRLSNADRGRLTGMMTVPVKIVSYLSIREVRRALYRHGPASFKDWVRLTWAEDPKPSNRVQWRALLALTESWVRPVFPLKGPDVMAAGVPEGPLVGRVLGEVEDWWIDADFTDDEFSLAERLKAVVQATI